MPVWPGLERVSGRAGRRPGSEGADQIRLLGCRQAMRGIDRDLVVLQAEAEHPGLGPGRQEPRHGSAGFRGAPGFLQDDDIRLGGTCGQDLHPVPGGLSHDGQVAYALEQPFQAAGKERVIVEDEDPGRTHGLPPSYFTMAHAQPWG